MTKFQKGFCVILCLCFFLVLAVMPEPFSRLENIYRQFPIYRFAEQKARGTFLEADWRTEEKLIEENAEYVGQLLESTQAQQTKEPQVTEPPQVTEKPQVNRGTTADRRAPDHREITGDRTCTDDRSFAGDRNCAAPSCDRSFTGKAGR